MSEKTQFDSSIGGTVELPAEISYLRYAAARSKEIQFLKKSLKSSTSSKLAFQKLPKHMRRRAMSHNAKRLPRRLRQIHLNQLEKSGLPQKQKKSSRKYKRRPNNLVQEYARRQNNRIWLNTHLWHAKRFHMIEKWGYKLPNRPCDKAFRACYRASVKYCLLQDISYYSCLEIKGNYDLIVDEFRKITCQDFNLTIGAKAFCKGNKEGCITILQYENPQKSIGKVYFNWRPLTANSEAHNQLWLWVHAAFYTDVLETLLKLFSLKHNKLHEDNIDMVHQYTNDESEITLSELKTKLSRFRLTGPQSNFVVQNCFKPSRTNNNLPNSSWFQDYLNENEKRQIFVSQIDFWSQMREKFATELPPHTILSLITEDPRMNLPKKRTKSVIESSNNFYLEPPIFDICFSELWDENVRNSVEESKISNAKICEMRSKFLVPGSDSEEYWKTPVPLLFVQRPGCKNGSRGYGAGYDIILPASWAQPIWISLIMWGARAGGLRETNSINFEMRQELDLLPDTKAGQKEEKDICQKYRETYFRKPPNRRINYSKFSISCPFEWKWSTLINDWCRQADREEFQVIRSKKILNAIQNTLISGKSSIDPEWFSQPLLVPIHLECSSKGLPMKFGIICLPQLGDYKNIPVEPLKMDSNQNKRKELRRNHKSILKCLRQRRVRAKKIGKILPIDMDMLENYTSTMRKLWLPETNTLRYSCSRQVIGRIRHGDFSFSLAEGCALGYIAVGALPLLMETRQRKVLFRNPNSRQYRLGTINVICE